MQIRFLEREFGFFSGYICKLPVENINKKFKRAKVNVFGIPGCICKNMRKINVDFQGNQSKKVKASGNSRRVIAKSNGNPEKVNSKKINIFKYVGAFAMHDGYMCNCNLTRKSRESKKATEQKKSFKNSSIMIL